MTLDATLNELTIPKHIAIIADGNRRWAKQQGMLGIMGHKAAVDRTFEPLIRSAQELSVQYLTFWVFSTENWKRPAEEIELLMQLFRQGFDEKIKLFHQHKVRLQVIGDLTRFPNDIQETVKNAVRQTAEYQSITVIFAMNYGGRDELIRAMHRCADQKSDMSSVSAAELAQYLDTAQFPDPDLIIRTGGEQRLSGFMLWQAEYAELYFTQVLFPDFSADELQRAVIEFSHRQRRYGGG